jgi:hypothetical protein
MWLVALAAAIVLFGVLLVVRELLVRSVSSAKVASKIERDKAEAQAKEVLHAPDDDLARVVDEMRAIGRGDKDP